MAAPRDVSAAARHLDALAAEPRPAGGEAEATARAYCGARLSALGFRTREVPFEYSGFPGRWATPAGGSVSLVTLAAVGHLGAHGWARAPLVVLVAALLVLGAAGAWLARHGVLDTPMLRERGVNLVAERGAARVWLVAHLDSKSQPVPMVARVGGIVGSGVAWVAMLALASAAALGARAPFGAWLAVTAIGALAALPVVASTVGARSAGALDNASGVATVLRAAALLPADLPLGVLLTSAEELGLAGARAFASLAPPAVALNVDGVDDAGEARWMVTGRRAESFDDALRGDAGTRVGRLIPGILVDAVALADAGWSAATLSKGTLATLRRIHTPADARERLRGDGVEECAGLLAAAAQRLSRGAALTLPSC